MFHKLFIFIDRFFFSINFRIFINVSLRQDSDLTLKFLVKIEFPASSRIPRFSVSFLVTALNMAARSISKKRKVGSFDPLIRRRLLK